MINDLIQAADKNMYQDKFYKKMCISKSELPASSQPASVIPTVPTDFLVNKIRQFQSSTENLHPVALVSTDIENFHYINDKYGYPIGNEILNILYEELASSPFSLFTVCLLYTSAQETSTSGKKESLMKQGLQKALKGALCMS